MFESRFLNATVLFPLNTVKKKKKIFILLALHIPITPDEYLKVFLTPFSKNFTFYQPTSAY